MSCLQRGQKEEGARREEENPDDVWRRKLRVHLSGCLEGQKEPRSGKRLSFLLTGHHLQAAQKALPLGQTFGARGPAAVAAVEVVELAERGWREGPR